MYKNLIEFKEAVENGDLELPCFLKEGAGLDYGRVAEFVMSLIKIIKIKDHHYVYHNGVYRKIDSEELMQLIETMVPNEFKEHKYVKNVYKIIDYRSYKNPEILCEGYEFFNQYSKSWIPFNDCYYDLNTGEVHEHNPDYYDINQLPFSYEEIRRAEYSERIEAFLNEALPDPEDREMFLQYCAYSLTRDTSEQKAMLLKGKGGTGKSVLLALVENMFRPCDISHVSIKEFNERFAVQELYNKLVNIAGDIKTENIKDNTVWKGATGEDTIRGDRKYKSSQIFKSSAKHFFSTNEENSFDCDEGCSSLRRLLIVEMNRIPEKEDRHLKEKLIEDEAYFLKLVLEAGERYVKQEKLFESNNSKKAKIKLTLGTSIIRELIKEAKSNGTGMVLKTDFYKEYVEACRECKIQSSNKEKFYNEVKGYGIVEKKINGNRYFHLS